MALTLDPRTHALTYRSADDELALLAAQGNGKGAQPQEVSRFEDVGSSGNVWISGIQAGGLGAEYNPDLRGDKARKTFDRMRRSDGQVQAVLRVCSLPLLRAKWAIKEASDDPLDVAVGQFVADNLFGGLDGQTFPDVLRNMLTAYPFGYSVQAKQWALGEDGKARLRHLTPLNADTIYRWWPDDAGKLLAITQRVYRPLPAGR